MRVAVVGTSGAGKTTFAATLAARLAAPHVDLDAINWQAGWVDLNRSDPELFRRRVKAAISVDCWVSCGNYSAVRSMILARATHFVWLDYTRSVVMSRVIRRSLSRAISGRELWPGTGNREYFRRWLSREHPIRWAWDTYDRRRRDYAAMLDDPHHAGLVKCRLRHPREALVLIDALAEAATT